MPTGLFSFHPSVFSLLLVILLLLLLFIVPPPPLQQAMNYSTYLFTKRTSFSSFHSVNLMYSRRISLQVYSYCKKMYAFSYLFNHKVFSIQGLLLLLQHVMPLYEHKLINEILSLYVYNIACIFRGSSSSSSSGELSRSSSTMVLAVTTYHIAILFFFSVSNNHYFSGCYVPCHIVIAELLSTTTIISSSISRLCHVELTTHVANFRFLCHGRRTKWSYLFINC